MRECNDYEITVSKLLDVVHKSTERIKIHVVSDILMFKDNMREFYITENFSENRAEMDRVLKYYGDVPVWNIHTDIEDVPNNTQKGKYFVAVIVANCHYSDVREGYLREKEDIRKAKRREHNQRLEKKVCNVWDVF